MARWFNTDAGFNKVTGAAARRRTCARSRCGFDSCATDNVNNVDLSLIKNTTLIGGKTLQFRFESLNAFNHPLFPATATSPIRRRPTFGTISASTQQNYARRMQVTVKFLF